MNSCTWTSQCWTKSKYLLKSCAGKRWNQDVLAWITDDKLQWRESIRDFCTLKVILYCWCYIYIYIYIFFWFFCLVHVGFVTKITGVSGKNPSGPLPINQPGLRFIGFRLLHSFILRLTVYLRHLIFSCVSSFFSLHHNGIIFNCFKRISISSFHVSSS